MSNTSWSIVNFRANLIARLAEAGHRVAAAAPQDSYSGRLSGLAHAYLPLPMDNKGRNPASDSILFARILGALSSERPDCLLTFTIKPNIYGSLAARLLKIPVINNIAGLGSVFSSKGPTQALVRQMYRSALARSHRVFFQNQDDHKLFVSLEIVDGKRTAVLPGSGVDTEHFRPAAADLGTGPAAFLFLGRLLREKGLPEYVAAARIIKSTTPSVAFRILGFPGVSNPSAVSPSELMAWADEGMVDYLGETDDVRSYLGSASCVVLPSYYREGVPRSLLEAASMGKVVITTDTPGCRDTVVDGKTGFLVAPRSVAGLVEKMRTFLSLSDQARQAMGERAREHVLAKFDEGIVIGRYLEALRELG